MPFLKTNLAAGPGSFVGCVSDWYSGHKFDPLVQQQSFVEIGNEIISTAVSGYEIISMAILSLLLIQVSECDTAFPR